MFFNALHIDLRGLGWSGRRRGYRLYTHALAYLAISLSCLLPAAGGARAAALDRGALLALVGEAEDIQSHGRARQALEIYLRAEDGAVRAPLLLALIRNRLGYVLEQRGRYPQALLYYKRGLTALAGRRDTPPVSGTVPAPAELRRLFSAGVVKPALYADVYPGDVPYVSHLLALPQARAEALLVLALTINAGNMYLRQGAYAQAEGMYQKALMMAKQLSSPDWELRVLVNLAWSQLRAQRYEQAAPWLERALQITQGNDRLAGRALLAAAVHAQETGAYEAAVEHLQHALRLYDQAGDLQGTRRVLNQLGSVYLVMDNGAAASGYFARVMQTKSSRDDPAAVLYAMGGLANSLLRSGELSAAVHAYESYLHHLEQLKRTFRASRTVLAARESERLREYVYAALDLARSSGDFTAVHRAVEANHAFRDAAGVADRRHPPPAGWLPAHRLWVSKKSPIPVSARVESDDIGLSGASGTVAPSARSQEAVTFAQWYVLEHHILAFVVQADGKVDGLVLPIGQSELAALIMDYRRSLALDGQAGAKAPVPARPAVAADEGEYAGRLYDLLIKPLLPFLPKDPDKTLVLIPDGPLWLLPFAALQDMDGHFLLDQYVLSYATSLASWRRNASRPRAADQHRLRAWIAADVAVPVNISSCGAPPNRDQAHPTEREARAVQALLSPAKADLFLGSQADRLRLEAWHSQYSLFHLAVGALGCADAELDALLVFAALSEQQLQIDRAARRVQRRDDPRLPVFLHGSMSGAMSSTKASVPGVLSARMVMRDYWFEADLITLSAARTGLGKSGGVGLRGLAEALLTAGARSLATGLWVADPVATEYFIVRFYQGYLRHGRKARALQQAMQAVREAYPHPRRWAGFVLIGLDQ